MKSRTLSFYGIQTGKEEVPYPLNPIRRSNYWYPHLSDFISKRHTLEDRSSSLRRTRYWFPRLEVQACIEGADFLWTHLDNAWHVSCCEDDKMVDNLHDIMSYHEHDYMLNFLYGHGHCSEFYRNRLASGMMAARNALCDKLTQGCHNQEWEMLEFYRLPYSKPLRHLWEGKEFGQAIEERGRIRWITPNLVEAVEGKGLWEAKRDRLKDILRDINEGKSVRWR